MDAVPGLSLTVEMRSGSFDDPRVGFSDIGAVTIGPDRRIYVVERQDREVRVLLEDGTLVARIGGPGEGPGEFVSSPGELGFIGDTLWVRDPQRRRVHLFSTDGASLDGFGAPALYTRLGRTVQARVGLDIGADGRLVVIPEGGAVVVSGDEEFPDSLLVPVIRVGRDGASRDTAEQVFLYTCCESPSGGLPQGDLVRDPWPFTSGAIRRWTRDGTFTITQNIVQGSAPDSVVVSRTTFAGDLVYRRAYVYSPQRVRGPLGGALFFVPEDFDLPDFGPGVTDAVPGDDGSLWLRRDLGGSEEQTWLVLDPAGAPLGQVVMPATFRVRWVDGNEALAVERDEFDVPWLLRLTVG